MGDSGKMMNAWKVQIGKREPIRCKVPVPSSGPDGLLVKVLAMGVCHSDCTILAMDQTFPNWQSEFVLGHEGAGEIVELGANVDKAAFKVGDKVALAIVPGCRESNCLECSRNMHQICNAAGSGNYGLGRDGMFAEYIAVHSNAAVKIPDEISIEQAAIAPDAVLTAWHAMKYTADVKPDEVILIIGLGGLGSNAVQIAQHLGVKRILVCDRRRAAVDAAIKLGIPPEDAICTGDPDSKPPEAIVAEKNIVVDTVIDFAGHEQTFTSAQLCARPGGKIVMVGLLSPTTPLIPLVSVYRMLTIKGVYNGTVEGLAESVELLKEKIVKPQITTGSVEDLPKVLKDLDDGKLLGRTVLLPTWEN